MSNVIKLHPDQPCSNPDTVLELAKGEYSDLLIIGYDKEGFLDVRSNLSLNAAQANYMIDRFKHKLINGDYSEES